MYVSARQASRPRPAVAVVAVIIPLATGIVSSLLTSDAMAHFGRLSQPPLSPPAWLFPVAWTLLYVLMGIASYLIYAFWSPDPEPMRMRRLALVVYAVQLAFNFFWSLLFFGAGQYYLSFVWLIVMWALIIALVTLSWRLNRSAALLLVPYLAWTTFAAYLNISIAILN